MNFPFYLLLFVDSRNITIMKFLSNFCLATKLKYFSDYKLGINIPARAENSDLLNVDGEKNDYDWWVSFFFGLIFL